LIVRAMRKNDVAFTHGTFGTQARGLTHGSVVEITAPGDTPANAADDLVEAEMHVVSVDPDTVDAFGLAQQEFLDDGGNVVAVAAGSVIKEVVLRVIVQPGEERVDVYDELATHPAQRRWISKIMQL